jgi:hypothetical protein
MIFTHYVTFMYVSVSEFDSTNSKCTFSKISRTLTLIKGKAVPLQAWSGPEGSRKLRFPDFLITAQDGGKIVSLTHQLHLPPGSSPGIHFY